MRARVGGAMASEKLPLPYDEALELARGIVSRLAPACERIQIAGSVRRRKSTVGDIELLVIPLVGAVQSGSNLFTEQGCLLHRELDQRVNDGKLEVVQGHSGDAKARRYKLLFTDPPGVGLDIFTARPGGWGYQLAIRTGPAHYSRRLVTQRCKSGLLDDAYRCHDGHVWRSAEAMAAAGVSGITDRRYAGLMPLTLDERAWFIHAVHEEADFFNLIKGGMVEPHHRR